MRKRQCFSFRSAIMAVNCSDGRLAGCGLQPNCGSAISSTKSNSWKWKNKFFTPIFPSTVPTVEPTSLSFRHEIGTTPCPTLIGTITITADNQTSWKVMTDLLPWLYAIPETGTGNRKVTLYFNCQLDEYVSQILTGTVPVQLEIRKDREIKTETKNISVRGEIIKK